MEEGISEIPRMQKLSLHNLQHARIFDANHCSERINVSHVEIPRYGHSIDDTVFNLAFLKMLVLFRATIQRTFILK